MVPCGRWCTLFHQLTAKRIAIKKERYTMSLLLLSPVLASALYIGGGGAGLLLIIIIVVLLVR
jgi:hypothetical protein